MTVAVAREPLHPHVVIIGGGFTGLSAAYELSKVGMHVTVLEADKHLGGLAADFEVGGSMLERFYHHWFTNDRHVMDLIHELGTDANVVERPTRTGMYYANEFFRLSRPVDVLKFKPLSFLDRIRLGLLVLKARRVKDWRVIEHLTAYEWLISLAGERVFKVVWEPLLIGKFGEYANTVSAVWFWKKLVLRGGSRAKGGAEMLAYYRGGFGALTRALAERDREQGVKIVTDTPVQSLIVRDGQVVGVRTPNGTIECDAVIGTPALPIIAGLVAPHVALDYTQSLQRIDYLANVCLVLQLDRSLSDTYWLNVNDTSFPFVGVIEHTNFEPPQSYAGRHIVYLSKYLPRSHVMYGMTSEQLLDYAIPHLKKMFPDFDRAWVKDFHVWKADYAQPLTPPNYSHHIPPVETPIQGFFLSTMAQIYPEDRGTNYAIREGRAVGIKVRDYLKEQQFPKSKAFA